MTMFEFSKDFDEEVEDFLNIPLDNECRKSETNYATKGSSSAGKMNSSAKDEFVFDNFGEDEELLSFVENIDTTFTQNIHNPTLKSEPTNPTPSKESPAVVAKKSNLVQEPLDSFITRKNTSSPHVTTKRSSNLVTVVDGSPSSSKLKYERQFPGPAGLRLKRSRDSILSDVSNDSGFEQQLNVSIVSDTLSENANWVEMMNDVSAQSCEQSKILNEFSVVALKKLGNVARKVPVFAAVISNINASTADPSVILKDPTGVIRASFDEDLWAQYSHLLTVGSALLLRKVGMLSRSRRLSLLVTTYNVHTIYSLKPGDESSVLITRVTPSTILDSLYTPETTVKSCNAPLEAIKTSPVVTSFVNASSSKSMNANDSVKISSEFTNSRRDKSVPLSAPSINNELEGIDLDSLLGDF